MYFLQHSEKWVAEFNRAKEGVQDGERSGRPKDVITDEQIEAVHKAVMDDRRVTIRHLAKTLDISFGSLQAILTEI